MSFVKENVVIQDEDGVEYHIEQEDASVNGENVEEESVLLLVEEQEAEDDTFTCGTCQSFWTDLTTFLEHKKTPCRQMTIVENLVPNDSMETNESAEIHFEEDLTTNESDFLSMEADLTENDAAIQLVAENTNETDSTDQVFVQLAESDMEDCDADIDDQVVEDQDVDEADVDNGVLKSPTFPLQLENGEEELQFQNPKSCSFCGKYFTKKFDLECHQRSHTGERPFQCPICKQGFTQNSNMKKHLNSHKVWLENIRKAPQADHLTTEEQVLTEVVTTKGKKIQVVVHKCYSCRFCRQIVQGYHKFKSHMKTHSNLKGFKCPTIDCRSTFLEIGQLLLHIEGHKREEVPSHAAASKFDPCTDCRQSFASTEEVALHRITTDHTAIAVESEDTGTNLDGRKREKHLFILECTKCHVAFESHTEEGVHECGTERNPDATTMSSLQQQQQPVLSCEKCGKRFDKLKQLNFHRSAHRKVSALKNLPHTWKCPRCKATFATAKGKDQHSMESGCCPASCNLCQKSFADERYLRRHLQRMHSQIVDKQQDDVSESKFSCGVCQKTFGSQFSLKAHSLIHTGQLPFVCDFEQCTKSFNRQDKLKRHKLTHQLCARKYACPFGKHTGCSKTFYRFDKLKDHVRIHGTTYSLTRCRFCNEVFTSLKDLRQHTETSHTDQSQLKCFQCDQTFKWEKSRQEHHREAHGIFHFFQDDAVLETVEVTEDIDAVEVEQALDAVQFSNFAE